MVVASRGPLDCPRGLSTWTNPDILGNTCQKAAPSSPFGPWGTPRTASMKGAMLSTWAGGEGLGARQAEGRQLHSSARATVRAAGHRAGTVSGCARPAAPAPAVHRVAGATRWAVGCQRTVRSPLRVVVVQCLSRSSPPRGVVWGGVGGGSAASGSPVPSSASDPLCGPQWRPPGRHCGFKGDTPVRLDPLGTYDHLGGSFAAESCACSPP